MASSSHGPAWPPVRLREMVTKTEVLMGRSTADNQVDINVAAEAEGPTNKISRQQAVIKLKEDGQFYIRNIGRKPLYVNRALVDTGQRALLFDSCLIEVAGISLVFEANKVMVNRLLTQVRNKGGAETIGSTSESESEFY